MKTIHSNTGSNHKKLWDEERILNFCKVLSEDVYIKITTDFFEKNNRIDILIEAINSEETILILKECHALRGSSTMIGLVAFNDIIDTIEQSSKKQRPLNKSEIISTINELLKESKNQFLKLT
jgi:hypothetical protein